MQTRIYRVGIDAPFVLSTGAKAALYPDDFEGGNWPNTFVSVSSDMMAATLDAIWQEADNLGWGVALQSEAKRIALKCNGIAPAGVDRVLLLITDASAACRVSGGLPTGKPGSWLSTVVLWDVSRPLDKGLEAVLSTGLWRRIEIAPQGYNGPLGRLPLTKASRGKGFLGFSGHNILRFLNPLFSNKLVDSNVAGLVLALAIMSFLVMESP